MTATRGPYRINALTPEGLPVMDILGHAKSPSPVPQKGGGGGWGGRFATGAIALTGVEKDHTRLSKTRRHGEKAQHLGTQII